MRRALVWVAVGCAVALIAREVRQRQPEAASRAAAAQGAATAQDEALSDLLPALVAALGRGETSFVMDHVSTSFKEERGLDYYDVRALVEMAAFSEPPLGVRLDELQLTPVGDARAIANATLSFARGQPLAAGAPLPDGAVTYAVEAVFAKDGPRWVALTGTYRRASSPAATTPADTADLDALTRARVLDLQVGEREPAARRQRRARGHLPDRVAVVSHFGARLDGPLGLELDEHPVHRAARLDARHDLLADVAALGERERALEPRLLREVPRADVAAEERQRRVDAQELGRGVVERRQRERGRELGRQLARRDRAQPVGGHAALGQPQDRRARELGAREVTGRRRSAADRARRVARAGTFERELRHRVRQARERDVVGDHVLLEHLGELRLEAGRDVEQQRVRLGQHPELGLHVALAVELQRGAGLAAGELRHVGGQHAVQEAHPVRARDAQEAAAGQPPQRSARRRSRSRRAPPCAEDSARA